MNWKNVWELFKINILYSNPQTLSAFRKKQSKNPNKNKSAYKNMLKQQALTILLFLFIYLFMFLGIDYKAYPGMFSFYIAVFYVISLIYTFSAMYSIFYDSNDLKLYAYLPIKQMELYMAKLLSAIGMGAVFMAPVFSLFVIAYWKILGNPLSLLLAIINFTILFISLIVASTVVNSYLGKIVERSPHKKLISTLMMTFSTITAMGVIFYLNFSNQANMNHPNQIVDKLKVPYFRGFYDVIINPFSLSSFLNFWLGLVVIMFLSYYIVKLLVPRYYQETLYTDKSPKKMTKTRTFKSEKQQNVLIKHHLSTLQNATVIINSFIMPFIFVFIFIGPALSGGLSLSSVGLESFGIFMIVGLSLGTMVALPTSLFSVALSLERENYLFLKTLPMNFKGFIRQKFLVFYSLQAGIPILVYFFLGLFILKINLSL
ncbi:hypothetical protein HMPREF9318_01302 [Streptococcus urinalis FB127-CNA-2]|uniref:Membrane protein n=1 Tax=Streptococcus urinalis 2285-97 TaxID=764291 RepID=G5KCN0_9STRE|nr:hypothetical protein [Streptococcus urinalis]EHJ55865.1 putative membrane protein [Streptococcus urinalis 2285-97]EKS19780.1 hypothetical protein HMPREF9318_01302 [Streptococcus urinalis FB127-CNA-2]VEF31356.1 ABC transporter permease [Streptococcus urinalis]